MKKFLLGVLAGVILAGVAGVVIFFASIKAIGKKPPLPDAACLVLDLQGPLPEVSTVEAPLPALEHQSPLTVPEIWLALDRAARDSRIKGVLLKPRGVMAGWAKLEEIRTGVLKVKKAGKPVYAWLIGPGMREYYLATAADQIFVSPEDVLDVKGLRIEASYYKGSLDKLGIEMEVEHVGKYKDAGDIFSRTSMTPETREVLNSILDTTFARITNTMGEGRKMPAEKFRALVDEGPFLAPVAKEKGLVDGLLFAQAAEEKLREAAKLSGKNWVGLRTYLSHPGPPAKNPRRFALLVAQGDILRFSGDDLFGEDQVIAPGNMRRVVKQITDDPGIRGVILRVDSPGGDAIASDEILYEIRELAKKKPLVVSMSDVAASGGYYISMTGDPVVAYPGTITGSIGVVYGKPNLKGLYDKLGISREILTRGRFADIDSLSKPLTPEARQKLRESLEFIYKGFLKRVSEGRKRPVQELEPLAQGRVWLGSQARDNKLIDETGGLDRAIAVLRGKAGLKAEEDVQLVVYPRRRSFFEQLFGTRDDVLGISDVPAAERLLSRIGPGVLPWLQGGTMRVLPYRVEIY